jgi:hypothetical protein
LRGGRGIIFALLAACILAISVCQSWSAELAGVSRSAAAGLSESEVVAILGNLNMPRAKVLAIRPSPVGGFWEVGVENNGQRFVIYVDSSKRYVTPGPFIDHASRKDVTRERIAELDKERRIDVSKLSLEHTLFLGKKDAPIKVIVFTDPG